MSRRSRIEIKRAGLLVDPLGLDTSLALLLDRRFRENQVVLLGLVFAIVSFAYPVYTILDPE